MDTSTDRRGERVGARYWLLYQAVNGAALAPDRLGLTNLYRETGIPMRRLRRSILAYLEA